MKCVAGNKKSRTYSTSEISEKGGEAVPVDLPSASLRKRPRERPRRRPRGTDRKQRGQEEAITILIISQLRRSVHHYVIARSHLLTIFSILWDSIRICEIGTQLRIQGGGKGAMASLSLLKLVIKRWPPPAAPHISRFLPPLSILDPMLVPFIRHGTFFKLITTRKANIPAHHSLPVWFTMVSFSEVLDILSASNRDFHKCRF